MQLDELIKESKHRDTFALKGSALRDLKKVLASNAREPHRLRRVSLAAFIAYLRSAHKIEVCRSTLMTWLHASLGRGWDR